MAKGLHPPKLTVGHKTNSNREALRMASIQPALASTKFDLHLEADGNAMEFWCGCASLFRAEPDTPEWNLLAAQLYNAGFVAESIANAFNRAISTLRRWGFALKSGAIDSVLKARPGAPTRLTPEIERFVRMRFRQIYRDTRDYNVTIRAEVERVFEQVFSSESLRLVFAKERNLIANELAAGRACDVRPAPATSPGDLPSEPAATEPTEAALADTSSDSPCLAEPATTTKFSAPEEPSRAITCEAPRVSCSDLPSARKYSLWWPGFLDLADGESTLCHFAGLLLMAPKIDDFLATWPGPDALSEGPQPSRQLLFQLLSGATNHEQSKLIDSPNLSLVAGPCLSTVSALRQRRKALASVNALRMLGSLNQRFALPDVADTPGATLLFIDPHSEEYTGRQKLLKGWVGSVHAIRKVLYTDFVHTRDGSPCFLMSDDNRCDYRERFFVLRERFVATLPPGHDKLIWISDRGLYGKDTFASIMELGDGFVSWERDYKRDAWCDSGKTQSFHRHRCRNSSQDHIGYRFQYQVSQWDRLGNVTRLIVRAEGQGKPSIEVSILCGNTGDIAHEILIWAIFRRWLQENDFSYLIRHFDLGQLDSRSFASYAQLIASGELDFDADDRQVQSRAHKKTQRARANASAKLGHSLVKRERSRKLSTCLGDLERRRAVLEQEREDLSAALAACALDDEKTLGKIKKTLAKLTAKFARHHKQRARYEAQSTLESKIKELEARLVEIEQELAEIPREESRLQALIDEGYVRFTNARKAVMDNLRIAARNIFYQSLSPFRAGYDNYRDDHELYRRLSRSIGFIARSGSTITVTLHPNMVLGEALRKVLIHDLERSAQTLTRRISQLPGHPIRRIRFRLRPSPK